VGEGYFLLAPVEAGRLYGVGHDPALVLLSVSLAVLAAFSAFEMVRRLGHGPRGNQWRLLASVVLGIGVWAMHFVGMLALRIACGVSYDPLVTVLSVLPGIAAAAAALALVDPAPGKAPLTGRRLLASGLIMAAGIGGMHYSGMQALRLTAQVRYEPQLFLLSLAAAAALAVSALWVRQRLAGKVSKHASLGGAVILGGAVAAMHYIAMAATVFIGGEGASAMLPVAHSQAGLATAVASAALLIMLLSIAVTALGGYLADTRRRFEALLESMPDAILVVDQQGRIAMVNQEVLRLLGYTRRQLLGASVESLLPEGLREQHEALRTRFMQDGERHQMGEGRDFIALRQDGGQLPVEISLSRLGTEEGRWVIAALRDTSHRHEAEALQRAARQEAEEASRLKSDFLATVSHELRTPMNGVIGFAELLLLPGLEEARQREYASTILSSSRVLLTLLDEILDLSKIEAGKMQLVISKMEPEHKLQEITAIFQESARRKGLALESVWRGPTGAHYLGDGIRVRQMLANLINNAIKFTERGGVRVEGTELARDTQGATLEFSVVDTGIGIAPEKVELLFRPFSQIGQFDAGTTRGTGLGLSIVRKLARMMDGDAGVQSSPGGGSRFWIRLRVQPAE
jgi:PAS domain S-box-containing protein